MKTNKKPYWKNKGNRCSICGKEISNTSSKCDSCSKLGFKRNWRGGKEKRKCLRCGKEFYVFPCRKKVFCSKSCASKGNQSGFTSENMSGKNNTNWKGGISKDVHSTREPKYKKWREAVFERDNYTCQGCGEKGCYLEAHHIKSWADYPELRYVLSNGLTLCLDCHKLTDNYRGKNNG